MIDILHQKPLLGRQINWAHPLARGLISSWLFNEKSGNRIFDVTRNGNQGAVFGAVWESDGLYHVTNDYIYTDICPINDYPFTFVCWALTKSNTPYQVIMDAAYSGATNVDYGIAFHYVVDSPYTRLGVRNGGGLDYIGNSTLWLNLNEIYQVVAIFRSATYRELFINGQSSASGVTSRAWNTDCDRMSFGAWGDSSRSSYLDGTVKTAYVYNRELQIEEIRWLYREPYAMFEQNRVRWFSVAAGAALFASIADTVGVTDTTETKVGNVRNISDNIGLTDVLSKIATYIRTLADNLASTDIINTARNLKKSFADDVGITDTITTAKGVFRAILDDIGITDIITKIKGAFRTISDTLSISDILSTIGTFIRNVADSIGITDVLTSKKFVLVALADTVGITDVLSKIGTFIRSIPDNIGITDVLAKIGTYKRSITDTANITDTTTASKGVFRSVADSVGITDVISAVLGKVTAIADSIGITDTITFIKTTVVGGRVFIVGIAKSLRISSKAKSLRISGEDKSLRISGESED